MAEVELHALVVGHTDHVGSDEYNVELSLRRAGNIRNHMIGQGIEAGRIQWAARGESEPVAGGDSDESRALNRRVEIFYFYPVRATAEHQYGITLTFGQ